MGKDRSRKSAKRTRAITIDDDLAELASVLDETRLDNNAKGWFSIPWRDGWNAVELAFAEARHQANCDDAEISKRLDVVSAWVLGRQRTAEIYWKISEFLSDGTPKKRRAFYACLRCMQVLIADSHGGGQVYNDILRSIFDDEPITQRLEVLVMEHRSVDALGASSDQRARQAFRIAWGRQLYLAAYAIRPGAS